MLWDSIANWSGEVEVNGTRYSSVDEARKCVNLTACNVDSIILHCTAQSTTERKITRFTSEPESVQYRISVRQYMTRKSTPDFDFMAKWNNDNPMPLRTMIGTVEKETKGMVYMKLHGDVTCKITQFCLRCGRPITNPISQYFGMGPECGGHNYTNPFESEEELLEAVEEYRKNYLQKITWEGWIIKSAITEKEIV